MEQSTLIVVGIFAIVIIVGFAVYRKSFKAKGKFPGVEFEVEGSNEETRPAAPSSKASESGADAQEPDNKVTAGSAPPQIEDPGHVAKLLEIKRKRLRVLEEQAAYKGLEVPASITMEIDDLKAEIAKLSADSPKA